MTYFNEPCNIGIGKELSMTKLNFVQAQKRANSSLLSITDKHLRVNKSVFSQITDLTAPVIGSVLGKNYFFKRHKKNVGIFRRYLSFLNLTGSDHKRVNDLQCDKEAKLYFYSYFSHNVNDHKQLDLKSIIRALGGLHIYGIDRKSLLGFLISHTWYQLSKDYGIDYMRLITGYGKIGNYIVFQSSANYKNADNDSILRSLNHDLLGGSISDSRYMAIFGFITHGNKILDSYNAKDLKKDGINCE